MLSHGLSRSPVTPRMRRSNLDLTGNNSSDQISLEQRMQFMIDMQNAYTESFQRNQDESRLNGLDIDIVNSAPNSTNDQADGSTVTHETNSITHNSIRNDFNQSESQIDLNVGMGQLIFSNAYYQQQNLQLHPPPSMEQHQQQQQQQQLQQQPFNGQALYAGYDSIDNHRAMIDADEQNFMNYLMSDTYATGRQSTHDEECCCCCCCLWDPLVKSLQQLVLAESIHRSFCYAAIDGMLTGAGLIATLVGFVGPINPIMTTTSTLLSKTAVAAAYHANHTFSSTMTASSSSLPSPWMVAICFTACTADALCMAVGHVWNTHVVSTLAARERLDERLAFAQNRQESKAKLVGRLLARGMLKIDAVSIADTLEGYPDLFVGTLVGDAIGGATDLGTFSNRSDNNDDSDDDNNAPGRHRHDRNNNNYQTLSDTYRSYGQFNQWDHDPDGVGVAAAVAESQIEAVVMCVAFSLFGTIPAALYYGISCWVLVSSDVQQTMSARSAALTLAGTIIWFLGVWKSKFLDSNWIIFGIETVVVLLLAVLTAFVLGIALAQIVTIPILAGTTVP